jgi:biotin synthase
MSVAEILDGVRRAGGWGYRTVVLQAGEDPKMTRTGTADLIRRIKSESPLAITLCFGERSDDDLAAWKAAGADRYLLKFETSRRTLYDRIHPPRVDQRRSDRVDVLCRLRQLGYEVGSGVMIGIPGQTYDDLARDIDLFAELDLDMIGLGPYLKHPNTPLGQKKPAEDRCVAGQVPADELMTNKVIALTRLVCPRANIPSTTALAAVNPVSAHQRGLTRGANVVMPNFTPRHYGRQYEIYPQKVELSQTSLLSCHTDLCRTIDGLGRRVGIGRGDSPSFRQRKQASSASETSR